MQATAAMDPLARLAHLAREVGDEETACWFEAVGTNRQVLGLPVAGGRWVVRLARAGDRAAACSSP